MTTTLAPQRARLDALEAAFWADPEDAAALADYQAACRAMEGAIAAAGDDPRHAFVVVIPVADSPQQLAACLDSLQQQCRLFDYGGTHGGRYRKVSVLLADDSRDPAVIARNRALAVALHDAGVTVEYFGLEEQLALLGRAGEQALHGIVGEHAHADFARKGQAMMRNIAYLRCAEIAAARVAERLLFYTVDADQTFAVRVPTADGGRTLQALNYFDHLDRLFDDGEVRVLTGKVVGDPPVSPAVMAGNFLDDVLGFVGEMATLEADAAYRQPAADTRGSGEAAYHDMADMFGFAGREPSYRYRCNLPGTVDNSACLADFARHLNSFFHGEHPTRITWYRHQAIAASRQPARTVYTGNYVFSAHALDWFIPFAPLRLRMSGPTMGRMLKASLGDAFVSANVPMLHRRTLADTGSAEFRPGVVEQQRRIDLSDEFERQFHGDVMLFSMEQLTALGYPDTVLAPDRVAGVLDATRQAMRARYADKQQQILARLAHLRSLWRATDRWWHTRPGFVDVNAAFEAFFDNIARNFGEGSPAFVRIDAATGWPHWRARQLAAICALPGDRAAWHEALRRLSTGA